MAAYPSAHLLLLLLLLSICCGVAAALSFSYNFSVRGDLDSLNYTGDSSPSSDRVDLTTKGNHSSTGRVFYQQPVHLWDSRSNRTASFNTSFSFAISIGSASSSSPTSMAQQVRGGGGMAFFIGSFPPNLGFFNVSSRDPNVVARSLSPPTVAVEFDTDHMGITIINTRRYQNWTTMGLVEGDGVSAGTMSANVVYDGGSKLMVVSLRVATGRSYSINRIVDFIDAELPVPDGVAIGFAAAAAANIESNQLLSWSFSSKDPTSRKTPLWVIILVVAAVMLVGFVATLLCVILCRRRQRRQRPIHQIELQVAREFSYPKLAAATNNFSEDRKLGAGSFGEVYRGDLQDPSMPPVAVKRLTTMIERTMTDYVTEVTTLGRISHRNLVRLVGWCDGGGDGDNAKLLLVYELVARGSLDKHLHGSDPDLRLLTWAERYNIVLDIGYAIEYLHTGCPNPILHRDIKSSNVMLDNDFVAKLGDFGLVRQAPGRGQGTLAGTAMIGSSDYIDPVCISNGTVSTASDMYSFGVLLLEMATGKDPAAMREKLSRQYALVEAVQESYRRGRVLEMADKRLNGNYEEWQMERVLVVGLLCVQAHRQDRPTIKESIAWLSYPKHEVPAVRLPMYSPVTKTSE